MTNFSLSDNDKELINTIEDQVKMLMDKSASDQSIFNSLEDFVPDILCILNGTEENQLITECRKNPHFGYFIVLVNKLIPENL